MPLDKEDAVKAFVTEAKAMKGDLSDDEVSISVACERGVGSTYGTITGVEDVNKPGEKVELKHNDGEVWLLDFWATWCPPCQAPMAHNQKMLEEHGGKWGDKLRIIGLSIDNNAETVKSHVESKGWQKIEHFWRSGSTCSKDYGVSGVPHVMLIDTKGKIVFKGHPANRTDLVADFNTLLEGGTISGQGTEPTGGAGAGAAAAPKGKDLDIDEVHK